MKRRLRLDRLGVVRAALRGAVPRLRGRASARRRSARERRALERYGGEVVTLVVATEGIEAGESVTQSNAVEREWLVDLAPEDAVTEMDAVLGDKVSVPVAAGAPLTGLNFRSAEEAVEVPADRVALSVPLDDALGVPPGTAAGATLAAYEAGADGVRLISDDVRVLARCPRRPRGRDRAGSVTIAADPDEVAQLLAASDEGSLRLAPAR